MLCMLYGGVPKLPIHYAAEKGNARSTEQSTELGVGNSIVILVFQRQPIVRRSEVSAVTSSSVLILHYNMYTLNAHKGNVARKIVINRLTIRYKILCLWSAGNRSQSCYQKGKTFSIVQHRFLVFEWEIIK